MNEQKTRRRKKHMYTQRFRYGMMLDCWSQYPEERPTFPELEKRLERLLQVKSFALDDFYTIFS